jgi:hypothetical protein
MKRLLLAAVAAPALLNVVGTQTFATNLKLPDEMLGPWCGQWGYQFPNDDAEHWWRADDVENCGNRGGLHVRKGGWDYYRFGPLGSCKFTKIEFRRHGNSTDHVRPLGPNGQPEEKPKLEKPPTDVYLVHATCKFRNKPTYENYEIQTSDDWLILRPLRKAKQ